MYSATALGASVGSSGIAKTQVIEQWMEAGRVWINEAGLLILATASAEQSQSRVTAENGCVCLVEYTVAEPMVARNFASAAASARPPTQYQSDENDKIEYFG
jgi:hypothetical protein